MNKSLLVSFKVYFKSFMFLILYSSISFAQSPSITSTVLSDDNSGVIVTFSESVFNSNGGSGGLETSDFVLTLGGGNATLTSATPTSISVSGNVYTLGLPLSGTPNGFEIITVWPSSSTSIYDASGNSALPPDYLTSGLILNLDSKDSTSFSWTSTGTTLSTTWNDLSGNNNHFSTFGDPEYDINKGVVFKNGQTADYFMKSSFPHPTTTFTDEFFIKTSRTTNSTWKSYNYSGNDNHGLMMFYQSTNSILLGMPGADYYTGVSFADGNWHHLVRTSNRTSGEQIIYIDGVNVYQNTREAGSLISTNGYYNIGQEMDSPGGSLDANQAFEGYIPVVRMYNKVLTSSEVTQNYNYVTKWHQNMNRVKFGPIITGTTITASNTSITVTFSEEVYGAISADAALEASDFSLTLSGGNATLSSETPSSITKVGNGEAYTLYFSLNGTANGDEELTVSPVLNSIYGAQSDPAIVLQSNNTVNLNDFFAPVINSTTVTSNNSNISVTFSESIYNATGGSGLVEASDFTLSLLGGNATLSSATPSSISINGNVYTLGLSLSGTPNGSETITVVPSSSSAIYDAADNAASTSQSNNTVNLNSPNSTPTDILLSPNSVYENVSLGTIVGFFSTIDSDSGNSHSYSFVSGSGSDDNVSFTISGANLLTNTSIDYEAKTTYSIRVQTNDQSSCYINSCTFTKTFTIQILDIIEDIDGDGVNDDIDNCLNTANTDQLDTDLDGLGNACDDDDDNDGYNDENDAFPLDSSQWLDTDLDGIADPLDNCPSTPNSDQLDTDSDETGDVCDDDDDNDTYLDINDAFPLDSSEWLDTDGDAIGNNADPDDDNDSYLDINDAFPLDPTEWIDTDSDGVGNNADPDDDNDSYLDINDAFPLDSSEWLDTDGDAIGNNTDTDDDNDSYLDINDAFPLDPTEWIDTDSDGIGNNADPDDDNDTYLDTEDLFPLDSSEWIDTDLDGVGNNADPDDDNDTYLDTEDLFPLDPTEWLDTDSDGVGNNTDTDDDNDGYLDEDEIICQSDPLNSGSLPPDYDGDFIPDCIDPDDDNDGCNDEVDQLPFDETICIDTDRDYVDNKIDLDDDNDGILDTVEAFMDDDVDVDGLPNQLDLDSDNDGCSDVLEAGFEDPDNDGFVGSYPIFVDSQGLVQGVVAYQTPLDENENNDFDFLEYGSDFAPVVALPDQVNYQINESVVFTISTLSSTNVIYQWQRSFDGGVSYGDLYNSPKFSGVKTGQLTLNNAGYPDNGTMYRVILTPWAYACSEERISNATLLFYNELFIPNAFSPNGDRVNDCWEILGLQNYPGHKLEVYNRLGIKLYETDNYQNDWCGTYNGEKLPDGTYFYQLYLSEGVIENGYIFVKR